MKRPYRLVRVASRRQGDLWKVSRTLWDSRPRPGGTTSEYETGPSAHRKASPIQLIVIAQALTIFVARVLDALILIMANRKSLMGGMRNKWWQNFAGIIGLIAVLALSIRLLVHLISG